MKEMLSINDKSLNDDSRNEPKIYIVLENYYLLNYLL
jgi:hypothetical protein